MKTVEEIEQIRRAYFLENKSMRQIAREMEISRNTVRKALDRASWEYTLSKPRPVPVLGPYKERINELLAENARLPRKQRYTSHLIYQAIHSEGYTGAESTVRRYVGQQRREKKARDVYLPLEYDPGTDAQVDWGEAIVIMCGEPVTVELFMMRLCYSRRMFVMAFPFQKQEAFLEGHVCAFHHFGGVPHRLTYDNLTTAVLRVLKGKNRKEQETFISFRSHYLYESNFCTPGQAHEKGGIEHGVGYARRNFLVPPPEVNSFEELNAHLLAACLGDDSRCIHGQEKTIKENWGMEKAHLLPLPEWDYQCCVTRSVHVNPYSQAEYETNRYSVPVDAAYRDLVLKAYPFQVEILHQDQVLATHPRCFGRNQDVIEPSHYLPLLEQRPGAFQHAKPMRRWREQLPPVYEQLLESLRDSYEGNHGIREFLKILKLHGEYPVQIVEQAVTLALEYGCLHVDGVRLCLHQLLNPETPVPSLDLTDCPRLAGVGSQSVDLSCYQQLLQAQCGG
ncbi:MAG: IS21 family transposase [Planctomycetota bacterium]|jgi:transposase